MQKKRKSIGFVYFKSYPDKVDKILIKEIEKKANVIPIPCEEQIDIDVLNAKTKNCNIILNYAVWEPVTFEGIELTKTLEELGKKVINSSHSFFYQEDKWMFYLKCLEHGVPTPRTFLIPKESRFNAKQIKEILNTTPIVLKAIFSDNGKCVEKVTTYSQFLDNIQRIIKKNPVSPVIAQEFIPNQNRSYRVTMIGHKPYQSVVKIGKSWKQTGSGRNEHFRKFKLNPKLKKNL